MAQGWETRKNDIIYEIYEHCRLLEINELVHFIDMHCYDDGIVIGKIVSLFWDIEGSCKCLLGSGASV